MASASAMQRAMAHNSHESPLTSLVRRASSRRIQPTPAITFQYDNSPSTQDPSQYQSSSTDFKPPHSPLLHGHFARDSYATASSYENSSYLDSSASGNSSRVQSFSSNVYPDSEIDYHYQYDTESAYEGVEYSQPDMNPAPALRDSWRSTATSSTARPGAAATIDAHAGQGGDRNTYSWADDFGEEYYGDLSPSPSNAVATSTGPASSPPSTTSQTPPRPHSEYESEGQPRTTGRTPITKPVANFSRPRPPPPPEHTEEQKRQVLQRNLNRQRSQSPGAAFRSTPSGLRNQVQSNNNDSLGGQHYPSQGRQGGTRAQGQAQPSSPSSAAHTHTNNTHGASSSSSLSPQIPPQPQPPPMGNRQSSLPTTSSSSLSPRDALSAQQPSLKSQNPTGSTQHQRPTGAAAPRVESTYSVYSNYSYYSYDTAVPSPTGSAFSNSSDPFNADHRQKNGSKSNLGIPPQNNSKQGNNRSPLSSSINVNNIPIPPDPTTSKPPQEPRSALDFLLLGIEHHEADRLNESARCFERSATEGGGCGVGMLMWGLTLRHGWGCPKNEKQAFKWLQRAAESAVGDLEATRARGIKDTSVVRTELVLAIYEVGQCFFQGWGVPKDQKMAFSYYKLAAELGDADAQMDVAFCYTNGKGSKKDKKEAAKWYRAAVKQGQSDVGLAWIYKDKYQ